MNTGASPASVTDSDRRNFFRVDDRVVLAYAEVDAETLPGRLREAWDDEADPFTLAATYHGIGEDTKVLAKSLRMALPEVADYLNALEHKIDLIAQVALVREMGLEDQPEQTVNLSAGGLEFHSARPIAPDTMLELRMVLRPSQAGILAGGRVIRCRPDRETEGQYVLAVEFDHMRETDRQLVVRHVLNCEARHLRERH